MRSQRAFRATPKLIHNASRIAQDGRRIVLPSQRPVHRLMLVEKPPARLFMRQGQDDVRQKVGTNRPEPARPAVQQQVHHRCQQLPHPLGRPPLGPRTDQKPRTQYIQPAIAQLAQRRLDLAFDPQIESLGLRVGPDRGYRDELPRARLTTSGRAAAIASPQFSGSASKTSIRARGGSANSRRDTATSRRSDRSTAARTSAVPTSPVAPTRHILTGLGIGPPKHCSTPQA